MATPIRRRLHRSIPSIAAISLVLAAPAARAQSPQAESLFDQGDSLEKQGKTAEACQAFEASNRIEARAGTLIRLGACREQNHQLASAWSAYKDALTRVKDATKRKIATDKVAELAPRLSYLTVNVPAASQLPNLEITRDGHAIDPGVWNHPVPFDGGTYAIEAHAAGHVAWKRSTTIPDEHGQISIDVPALAEAPHVEAATEPPPPVVQPVPPPVAPAPEESAWTGKRKVAVVVAGVAVLAGVGGVVFGALAKSKQSSADKLCPHELCNSPSDLTVANHDLSLARSRALDANISFGIAGAAAIAAGVLWLTGAPEERAIVVAAAPGAAVLTFSGRF
ncbi:MAG: hypothetical protein ABI678_25765 [Kofleriaceae bacterium]